MVHSGQGRKMPGSRFGDFWKNPRLPRRNRKYTSFRQPNIDRGRNHLPESGGFSYALELVSKGLAGLILTGGRSCWQGLPCPGQSGNLAVNYSHPYGLVQRE